MEAIWPLVPGGQLWDQWAVLRVEALLLGGGEESGLPLGAQAPGRLLKPLVLSARHPAPEASATHSSISLWAPGGAEVAVACTRLLCLKLFWEGSPHRH